MMMRMLEAGGITCLYDDVIPADGYNPNGYYEYQPARTQQWDFLATADGKAVKLNERAPQLPDGYDYMVIIMRRPIPECIASWNALRATKERPMERPEYAARFASDREPLEPVEYGRFLQGHLDAIRTWAADKPHIEVWFHDMIDNPIVESQRVARFLGQSLNFEAMQQVPTDALRHHNFGAD